MNTPAPSVAESESGFPIVELEGQLTIDALLEELGEDRLEPADED
ncbi:hypothetical protein [Paenarthrobacter sp. DKR-5]|nr:hypothetical protein [Paenarthrobacter sp. DKR-5]